MWCDFTLYSHLLYTCIICLIINCYSFIILYFWHFLHWEKWSMLFSSTPEKIKGSLSSHGYPSRPPKFHFLNLYTHCLPWITHQALQGWPQPVINSLTADTNHVWLVSSRICCHILPVPCYCLDLCDPAGCPLTPRHMISVCDLWPVWIIKEAWPRGDCIGNLSMMISDLVWGKGAQMKASPIFRHVDTVWMWVCVSSLCLYNVFQSVWVTVTHVNFCHLLFLFYCLLFNSSGFSFVNSLKSFSEVIDNMNIIMNSTMVLLVGCMDV